MTLTLIQGHWIGREKQYISYGIQTVHDGRLMHDIYIYMLMFNRFDDLDLDCENVLKKTREDC